MHEIIAINDKDEVHTEVHSSKRDNQKIERLVRKASHGDKDALSELCTLISKDILFRALRIMNGSSDAEDVAQESLIRVCNGIRNLKEPKTFHKWLGSIVLNEARRHFARNAKRADILYLSDALENVEGNIESVLPESFSDDSDNREALMDAIDALPVRQREAIVLYYFDKLSVMEIAEIMEIAQPNVSRYLVKARSSIKAELETRSFSRARNLASGYAMFVILMATITTTVIVSSFVSIMS